MVLGRSKFGIRESENQSRYKKIFGVKTIKIVNNCNEKMKEKERSGEKVVPGLVDGFGLPKALALQTGLRGREAKMRSERRRVEAITNDSSDAVMAANHRITESLQFNAHL